MAAAPVLALPAGATPSALARRRLTLAVLLGAVAGTALFGGLIAAYLSVRADTPAWPPRGVELDHYLGTTLTLTLLLSMVSVEWGAHAVRRELRAQAAVGFLITMGFGLAYVVALSYLVSRLGVRADGSPYGTVVHSLMVLAGVANISASAGVFLVALRVLGRQVGPGDDHARAAAWWWHFTVVAWLAVWGTVFFLK